jgi:hypothetical protein
MRRGGATCWRGAAQRVVAILVVLVVALPSSAAAGAAAASPPPPTDMALLVARLGRLEATVREQARETRESRADARELERRVAELEAERRGEEQRDAGEEESQQSAEPRRRLQTLPVRGDVVHIHRVNVSLPAGPGWGVSPNYNGGHRRYLQSSSGQCGTMATRAQAVQALCCDDPTEDCSGGYPRTCNAGCAAVFLPFWAECGSLLGNAAVYQQTVALCQQASPDRGLAHEFNLVCANGAVGSCVPACSEALRGDLLLMNLNGEDSKYSCELHHGLHSWVGAATDGGYLGSDARAFVSAVLSGAAGYYALGLMGADVNIAIDMAIRPDQDVHISGGASLSAWGSGSFVVQQVGSLVLTSVALGQDITVQSGGDVALTGCTILATITVQSGGTLILNEVMFLGRTHNLLLARGASFSRHGGSNPFDSQCDQPYTAVDDAWRSVSTIMHGTMDRGHGDCASGAGYSGIYSGDGLPQRQVLPGGRWYRFTGASGDALPLTPPDYNQCGTLYKGWLSGWRSQIAPPTDYSIAGQYPPTGAGVVERTVCFANGVEGGSYPHHCDHHATVGVVHCNRFFLWRLPYTQGCAFGYCTINSSTLQKL